jgi:acyl-CoA thioesterase I
MGRHSISAGTSAVVFRASRAIAACVIVLASLFVFPNGVPWLIAAWLAVYTWQVFRGRYGIVWLVGCLAVLLAKRLTPAPGLLLLMGAMLAVILLGALQVRRRSPSPSQWFAWSGVLGLWILWAGMAAGWYGATHCRHPLVFDPQRPVVCIGDSMTSCGIFGGYPSDLQELLTVPVANLGIGGITALDTVGKFNELLPKLASHHPQAVVIELGGHDFLRHFGRAATKSSLKEIIHAVRRHGAEPVLMEIPRDYLSDPFWGLEREIAREEDVELVPDTAMRIIFLRSTLLPPGCWLGEPYLTDETGIHPNARGRQILAGAVAEALERMYGSRIVKGGGAAQAK